MAYRTKAQPDLSIFKNRLLDLMIHCKEYDVDTAKKLATVLYDLELVKVQSSESFIEPNKPKQNAIWSVEKKIQKHLKALTPDHVQGEFVIAYSKLFKCSAEYILCMTNIKSLDFDVREICRKTGLTETAVEKLMHESKPMTIYEEGDSSYAAWWSEFMETPSFENFPRAWLSMLNSAKLMQAYKLKSEGIKRTLDLPTLSEAFSLKQADKLKWSDEQAETYETDYCGRLYKLSMDFSAFLGGYANIKIMEHIFDLKSEYCDTELALVGMSEDNSEND